MSKNSAKVHDIILQQSEPFEFLADIDFEYDGLIVFEIDTTIHINLTVVIRRLLETI